MKIIKRIVLLFILCSYFTACNNSDVIVYEGAAHKGLRLDALLSSSGVLSRTVVHSDTAVITVPEQHLERTYFIFRNVLPIIDSGCDKDTSLSDFFIPRKSSVGIPDKDVLSEVRKIVTSHDAIFHVSCSQELHQMEDIVWFDSQDRTIDTVHSIIEKILADRHFSAHYRYQLKDVRSYIFGDGVQANNRKSRFDFHLIVFEPFSFHVLDREKVSVGIQLVTILMLFLFSGFIIGYWWARR